MNKIIALILFAAPLAHAGTELRQQSFSPSKTDISANSLISATHITASSASIHGAVGIDGTLQANGAINGQGLTLQSTSTFLGNSLFRGTFGGDGKVIIATSTPGAAWSTTVVEITGKGGNTWGLIGEAGSGTGGFAIENQNDGISAMNVIRDGTVGGRFGFGTSADSNFGIVTQPNNYRVKIGDIFQASAASNHIGASTFQSSVTVVDATKGVQIGTSSVNGAAVLPLSIQSSDVNTTPAIGIEDTNGGHKWAIGFRNSSSILDFHDYNTGLNALRLNNSGNATFPQATNLIGASTFQSSSTFNSDVQIGASTTSMSGAWTGWTPIVNGCSGAATLNLSKYLRFGKTVFFTLDISCTSNATTFGFTFPFTPQNGSLTGPCNVQDNGTFSTTMGSWNGDSSSSSHFTIFVDAKISSPTNWTNSGTKRAFCSGVVEIN